MASKPEVTCSPEATTASYSRASCIGEASVHQATSSLVLPDIAETTTATSCPASTSRFTWRATLRIRSILATDVPPNFITRRPMTTCELSREDKFVGPRERGSARAETRVYIAKRPGASGFRVGILRLGEVELRVGDGALYRRNPA